MSQIRLAENAIAPGTPSTGYVILYPKSDGLFYQKDDAGTERSLAVVAGSDTQVLFNDGGAIGADAGLVFNKTTNALTVGGNLTADVLLLNDSDDSHQLTIAVTSNLTAARQLSLATGDAARTITLSGDPTLADWFDQSVKTSADVNFNTVGINDSDDSHQLILLTTSNLTADRNLTLVPGDAARTLTISGDATISQDYSTTASPTFVGLTLSGAIATPTNITMSGALSGGTTSSFSSTGTFGGDLIFSADATIRRNTSDGSDSGAITINGGGSNSTTRGSQIIVRGNENGSAGDLELWTGNVGGAQLIAYNSAGTAMLTMEGSDGSATFTSTKNSGDVWTFNDTGTNGARMALKSSGTDNLFLGSGSIGTLGTNSDGVIYGNATLYVFATTWPTTASAANAVVGNGDSLRRSTSSARYKTNIEPMVDWRWLLHLTPITFNPKEDANGRTYGGLLAEDVAQYSPVGPDGKPLYAGLDAEGRPDDVAYPHLTAPIIKAIQELEARLARLEKNKCH